MNEDGVCRLTKVLTLIWKKGVIPEEWKEGVIIPVYKKGNENSVENYRGVSLMDSGYKIYTDILREKLIKEIRNKNVYNETQFGFRSGRGTIDAIYVLKNAVQKIIEKKQSVYLLFVDLKAAFDNVDRMELYRMLKSKNIDDDIIIRIMSVYIETKNIVKIKNKEIGEFWTYRGVRQGCKLSSEMYNVYVSDMEERLKKANEGGIIIGNSKIW